MYIALSMRCNLTVSARSVIYGGFDVERLSEGAAFLLRLIRRHQALTRTEIGEATGWARVTVNARIDQLLDFGLIRPAGSADGQRGRPATRFEFDAVRGTLLIADIGASAARMAACDLNGAVLRQQTMSLNIADGPTAVLDPVIAVLDDFAAAASAPIWAAGISLPGPIELPAGRIVSPPIMTGWHNLRVPDVLGPRLGVPILVENDSNAMAWGEYVLMGQSVSDLFFVKIGTGVGAGIVANGRIVRGNNGASGDLGHTRVEDTEGRTPPLCRCGKTGCVEAYAGGWAIARDLRDDGVHADSVQDVVDLVVGGSPHAIRRVRDAGRVLGLALANAVSLLNPAQIVVGGQLSVAGEHLLSGIRERVAMNSLPLATQSLTIRISDRPNESGVDGLAEATTSWILGTDQLPDVLRRVTSAQ